MRCRGTQRYLINYSLSPPKNTKTAPLIQRNGFSSKYISCTYCVVNHTKVSQRYILFLSFEYNISMDAFESLMATLLEREGYWVRNSFKVELTKGEKRAIGIPSSPRWELDLVAFNAKENKILVVECKSYFNSPGVNMKYFGNQKTVFTNRMKLFNGKKLRRIVLARMKKQMVDKGLCKESSKVQLCLATGKISSDDERTKVRELFKKNEWKLYDDVWIAKKVKAFASLGYENDVAAVVAKIILKNKD